METFDYLIGFSDHSEHWLLDIIAVVIGAKVIEKHFTLDHRLPGPDHKMALNPEEFKSMVQSIRMTEKALGNKKRVLSSIEKQIKPHALKGIYAIKNIKKGEKMTLSNIRAQRPFKSIPALKLLKILGEQATRDYKPFENIKEKY